MLQPLRNRVSVAGLAAPVAVGLTLACLAIGYEPIQGDPDLMYRPIKAELARALAEGRLPLWSDRMGLGVPLAAESHVAAFYPLNWLLYSVLPVATAFRFALWVHTVATACATFAYARVLGISPWGASLSAVAFSMCGFQASHAGHEPLYHALPFLPVCLLSADRLATTGRLFWGAILALAWGAQLTVGHFQIQLWTGGLVLMIGLWRVVADHHPKRRALALLLSIVMGACVAAPQLGLTWELTTFTSFARNFDQLSAYALPPSHLIQVSMPTLFLPHPGIDDVSHWGRLATSAGESTFYVGTVPLILACVGFLGGDRSRGFAPWRPITLASLALATMPHWWPFGYWLVTLIPGLGWFRCPGRYTLLTSLGLALLAGRGLDRTLSSKRYRSGLGLAITLALCSFAGGWLLASQPRFGATFGVATLPYRLGAAVLLWTISLIAIIAWRRGKLAAWALVAWTAVELGTLYHLGPVRWGWSVPISQASSILRRLADEPGVELIAGPLENLPLHYGLISAYPYLGIPPPPPNYLLEAARSAVNSSDPGARPLLRRFGVSHGVWHEAENVPFASTIWVAHDAAIDKLLRAASDTTPAARWKIVRYPGVWPPVLACREQYRASDWGQLYLRLTRSENQDEAIFLTEDQPPEGRFPRATSARVGSWDGRTVVVEHDGTCDLVVRRTAYPGWKARLRDGAELAVRKANGGLQSVRLEGPGSSRVQFSYYPRGLGHSVALALTALVICVLVLAGTVVATGARLEFGTAIRFAPKARDELRGQSRSSV